MALVLIKEDGTGKVDANSYANVADAASYFEGHLYATAWAAASAANKEAALVMATRLIDSQYQFGGTKTRDAQALQWPRGNCRDLDAGRWSGRVVARDAIPKAVVQATCEMARELVITDRTAAPAGEGLSYKNVGSDQTGYNKSDSRSLFFHCRKAMQVRHPISRQGSERPKKWQKCKCGCNQFAPLYWRRGCARNL